MKISIRSAWYNFFGTFVLNAWISNVLKFDFIKIYSVKSSLSDNGIQILEMSNMKYFFWS